MNCLEQDASKATSGDLTAYSTSLIAMFASVTNCMKVGGGGPRVPLAPPVPRPMAHPCHLL